ncbi:hypothetical protein [Acinetobacter sp.]|uniref:hypothetical protein n=1 Tax=Acinetobacter sp. TaxID=472 RepID=UPI0031DDFC31
MPNQNTSLKKLDTACAHLESLNSMLLLGHSTLEQTRLEDDQFENILMLCESLTQLAIDQMEQYGLQISPEIVLTEAILTALEHLKFTQLAESEVCNCLNGLMGITQAIIEKLEGVA